MRAGALDRRITLRAPADIDDPLYGPQPGGWRTFLERIPAQVLDDLPSRTETTEGTMRMSGHPARVRIRYVDGVTSDMQMLLHRRRDEPDRVYEITSTPAEIGRREWLEFTVKEFSS